LGVDHDVLYRVLENELLNKTVLTHKTIKLQNSGERRNIIWGVIASTFHYNYEDD
jgi:hypothetical protein